MRRHRPTQLDRIERLLQVVALKLNVVIRQEVIEMAILTDLQAEVARNTEVDSSAIALIVGLAAKIQQLIDAGADPAALQALVDAMKASSDSLASSVAANTPAA